ncbi:hypothetical protein CIPAW_11G165500 [Carya illinoinensis]|uniref:Transmembrane protein n=1 Tax=Carya illinoinensis TaxID=32201 RepID=A0A8T1P077_CARIL|nr:hypothetical protein CIPAW_11G165500 [Carya illinoinensis]
MENSTTTSTKMNVQLDGIDAKPDKDEDEYTKIDEDEATRPRRHSCARHPFRRTPISLSSQLWKTKMKKLPNMPLHLFLFQSVLSFVSFQLWKTQTKKLNTHERFFLFPLLIYVFFLISSNFV